MFLCDVSTQLRATTFRNVVKYCECVLFPARWFLTDEFCSVVLVSLTFLSTNNGLIESLIIDTHI